MYIKGKIGFDKNSLYSEKSALKGKCIAFNIKNLRDDIKTFDEFIKNKKVHELLYSRIYSKRKQENWKTRITVSLKTIKKDQQGNLVCTVTGLHTHSDIINIRASSKIRKFMNCFITEYIKKGNKKIGKQGLHSHLKQSTGKFSVYKYWFTYTQ